MGDLPTKAAVSTPLISARTAPQLEVPSGSRPARRHRRHLLRLAWLTLGRPLLPRHPWPALPRRLPRSRRTLLHQWVRASSGCLCPSPGLVAGRPEERRCKHPP